MIKRIMEKFKLGAWNIGIAENNIEDIINDSEKISIRWVKHKYRDRFFADPFLYDLDENNYYVLAEEFPFYEKKGFISLLTINRKTMHLTKKEKYIEESWHLSYPIVYNGRIIPEAYRSGKAFSYDLKNPTAETRMEFFPAGLIDQTPVYYGGYVWIFATDSENPLSGLKIFYRKCGEETWVPHAKNPIKINITNSRPGGNFFTINGTLYRPVQDSEECYGRKIRIMKIDVLNTEDFSESQVAVVDSDRFPPYNRAFHTFNVEDGFIVVDGYKEHYSYIVKPLCLKLPKLMKKFGERK